MKRVLIAFLLGVLTGAAALFLLLATRDTPAAARAGERAVAASIAATSAASALLTHSREAFDAEVEVLAIQAHDLRGALAHTARAARRKASELGTFLRRESPSKQGL